MCIRDRVELMDRAFAHGYHGLMRDVLQRMIRDAGLKVKGYEYHDLCYRMDSIQSYFQFNLDMLNTDVYKRQGQGRRGRRGEAMVSRP